MPDSRQPEPSDLKPGQIIHDRYKILSLIGRGGIGSVYKAEQLLLKKLCAIKTLNATVATEVALRRFQKEGQATSRLDHPNLVRAFDFGTIDDETPYLVMDFVEGDTLAQHLRRVGRLSVKEFLEIFIPISFAMAHAHEQGIIHRDIKPSNIVLAKDETHVREFIPKIVDFGIAKLALGDEVDAQTLTKTGEIFGTPLYMSPEQCAGTGVDQRTDIYSLGCVIYESLTGSPPFRGQSAIETMMQHGSGKLLSLKEASMGIEFPAALEKVLEKMLAKDPNLRYQNMPTVARDLALLEKGEVGRMEAVSAPKADQSAARIFPAPLWLLLVCVFLMGIGAGLLVGLGRGPASNPPPPGDTKTAAPAPRILAVADGSELYPEMGVGEHSFFRESHPGAVYFHFPDVDLGKIYWWHGNEHGDVNAMWTQKFLSHSKLLFVPAEYMFKRSPYWGRFLSDDLNGVVLKRPDEVHLPPAQNDFIVIAISQQTNLTKLSLENLTLSPRGFKSIGELKKLKWLCLRNIRITMGENGERMLWGSDVAALPNLRSLDSLAVFDLEDPSSAAKALKATHIRHLKLERLRYSGTPAPTATEPWLNPLTEPD